MEECFTQIYERCQWGSSISDEYSGQSGPGSEIRYNDTLYIPFLKNFIQENNIKTIADLGCGDFRCGPFIYGDLDITYTGYDVYSKIIDYHNNHIDNNKYKFFKLDFCNNPSQIADADIYIIKDVIQHWCNNNIYRFLDYLVENKKCKYILICNCCNQNEDNADTVDGGARSLSSDFLPLKKYNPKKLLYYNTKEISVIEVI